jgi:hypothetical protein
MAPSIASNFRPTLRFGLISLLVIATVPIPIIIGLCLVFQFDPFTASF